MSGLAVQSFFSAKRRIPVPRFAGALKIDKAALAPVTSRGLPGLPAARSSGRLGRKWRHM
jgi:hypothetical protein